MKVITMLRLTLDGEPLHATDSDPDPRDWWGVIETKEEEALYEMAMGCRKPLRVSEEKISIDTLKAVWDDLLCFAGVGQGVAWGDDDMYGYIRPDETVPEIGEEFIDGDGDKWKRME